MKVGVVTFQETNNYGALLQNYALSRTLRKLGASPTTIDYKSEYIGKPYRLRHLRDKGLMKYLLGVAGYIIYLPRSKKNNLFRRHISYTRAVTRDELFKLNNEFDFFITGSDQVWNYNLTGSDNYYLLDFVSDKSKCASFAASLGLTKIDKKHDKVYKDLLAGYRYLSVRENSARDALLDIGLKDVDVVMDPCVLLSSSEWMKLADQPKEEKYVYVYQLGVSKDVVMLAKRIAREKGLKVIFTPFPVGAMYRGKMDVFAGAAQVLGYIKNAQYVITDSFHGTLLSIIFNKRFFTKASGTHAAVGSRIYDLLDHYSLTDRMLDADTDYRLEIDYDRVNEILKGDRDRGLNKLKNIIDM